MAENWMHVPAHEVRAVRELELTTHQLFVLSSLECLPARAVLIERLGMERAHDIFGRCIHGVMGCRGSLGGHTEHVFPKE